MLPGNQKSLPPPRANAMLKGGKSETVKTKNENNNPIGKQISRVVQEPILSSGFISLIRSIIVVV